VVGSAPDRIEPEMVLDLMPQVFAEAGAGVVTGQPGQDRADEAVVLAGREIELLVVEADRVPPVEQVAQLMALPESRQAPKPRWRTDAGPDSGEDG
jgi:hypothetical protein